MSEPIILVDPQGVEHVIYAPAYTEGLLKEGWTHPEAYIAPAEKLKAEEAQPEKQVDAEAANVVELRRKSSKRPG